MDSLLRSLRREGQEEQRRESHSARRESHRQEGGARGSLPASATTKARAWLAEVERVKAETGLSHKEALVEASKRRRAADASYETTKDRYTKSLHYQGAVSYGSKNKRPLSLSAAQAILLKYYRDNRTKFAKGPLAAMRSDIAQCRDAKHTLTPCPANIKTRAQAKAAGHPCADSYKFRPGKSAKSRTGPGVYDMAGVNDFCPEKGFKTAAARKEAAKLYAQTRMAKKVRKDAGVARGPRKRKSA